MPPKNPLAQRGHVIHVREPENPETKDIEQEPVRYLISAQALLSGEVKNIARQVDNRAHVVDEYSVESTVADGSTVVFLQPTYDFKPEKIESILVNGPPAATFSLQLGDRDLTGLVMPASGVMVIAPVAILLGRNDTRQLTSATSGDWFLELMGIADERFDI